MDNTLPVIHVINGRQKKLLQGPGLILIDFTSQSIKTDSHEK